MRTQLSFGLLFAAVFACLMQASPAQAQRVFVSATGNDGNPCTFASPCRSFQHAHDVTSANGEIDVLDPAGYGAVTITKAISIQGHGFSGVSVPSAGVGITINAPSTDAVHLNGLLIEGGHVGNNGIVFNSGASLNIQDSIIRNFTNFGIAFVPSATSNLAVSDTIVADNGNNGIDVTPTGSGIVTATFNRVEASNNASNGIVVHGQTSTGTINATASDSVAARNGGVGFGAGSTSGKAPTTLGLFHSVAANNSVGIQVNDTGATVRAAQSMVTGNTSHGWLIVGAGAVQSYSDNYIDGNGTNSGTLTTVTKQ